MEFTGYALRKKTYIFKCVKHRLIFDLEPCPYEKLVINLDIDKVVEELKYKNFDGYSCLFFIIYFECSCSVDEFMEPLYNAIKTNKSLMYVTKIIWVRSTVEIINKMNNSIEIKWNGHSMDVEIPFFETDMSDKENTSANNQKQQQQTVATNFQIFTKLFGNTHNLFRQNFFKEFNIKTAPLENTVLIQEGRFDFQCEPQPFVLSKFCREGHEKSLREITESIFKQVVPTDHLVSFTSEEIFNITCMSAVSHYMFGINPALGIIINHFNFADQCLKIREGSENDVKRLKETFTHKKIPQLVLHDGSAEEVRLIMNKIATLDLTILKYLFIIVMSHGKQNDVIETRTESYSIHEDIVKPLMSNPSLQNVQILLMVNACRGDINPQFEFENWQKPTMNDSDKIEQQKNLMIWYSTQNGYVSLRQKKTGAIFIQQFCDVFGQAFLELPMKQIAEEVEQQLLQKWRFFERITDYKADNETDHMIKILFENLEKFRLLIEEFDSYANCGKNVKLNGRLKAILGQERQLLAI